MQEECVQVRRAQAAQRVREGLKRAAGAEVAGVQLRGEEERTPVHVPLSDGGAHLLLQVPLVRLGRVEEAVAHAERVEQRWLSHVPSASEADHRHEHAVV